MKYLLCSTALIASAAIAAEAPAAHTFRLQPGPSVEIPHSAGKFDFLRVDSKRHRLLASHEKDRTADYIDLSKATLIDRLKLGGAVDTAMDPDSKFYYVSVQDDERVAVVDAQTLKEVRSIKTAGPTDAIIFEPKNRRVYVTHDDGAEVWVIDPVSAKVVGTVVIPGVPEFMVYDSRADRIYLNIKDKDVVAVIDPSANKVIAQWPTAPATKPHGLAFDGDGHRVFAAGANGKLVSIDTRSGASLASVDIVEKVDQIAFDSVGGFVYCAGADKLSVVSTSGAALALLGAVETASSAKNVAVDPATRAVWTTFTDGKNAFAKSWMPLN